jgi:hypothetical protein
MDQTFSVEIPRGYGEYGALLFIPGSVDLAPIEDKKGFHRRVPYAFVAIGKWMIVD